MLNVSQRQNWCLNDIVESIQKTSSFIFFTASTMQEQRDIAEYICEKLSEKDIDCRHVDYSKKENIGGMYYGLFRKDDPSILVYSNFQEFMIGPYCKMDEQATTTIDVKINRQYTYQPYSELDAIMRVNMLRDYYRQNGIKAIFGMSPNFYNKIRSSVYNVFIDDFLDYVVLNYHFENPEDGEGMFEEYNENDYYPMDAVFWLYNNKVVYKSGRKRTNEDLDLYLSNAILVPPLRIKDDLKLKKR